MLKKSISMLPIIMLCIFSGCGNENMPGDYWEKTKELYKEAKEAGEKVPEDLMEWVKSDFSKIGTWEYKIVATKSVRPEEIETMLNELGNERWECYFVESIPSGRRFYLKRGAKSYIRAIPASDLAKLLSRANQQ